MPLAKPNSVRPALSIVLGLTVLAVSPSAVSAVDGRVRSACANDFLTYCGDHDPDGPGARHCMRANGRKLSQACLNALVAAGEVSKKEIARQSSK